MLRRDVIAENSNRLHWFLRGSGTSLSSEPNAPFIRKKTTNETDDISNSHQNKYTSCVQHPPKRSEKEEEKNSYNYTTEFIREFAWEIITWLCYTRFHCHSHQPQNHFIPLECDVKFAFPFVSKYTPHASALRRATHSDDNGVVLL